MKRALGLIATIGLLPLLNAQSPSRFPWRTDFESARQEAIIQDKPLLIVFRCEP